jgi:hypothetical protein
MMMLFPVDSNGVYETDKSTEIYCLELRRLLFGATLNRFETDKITTNICILKNMHQLLIVRGKKTDFIMLTFIVS